MKGFPCKQKAPPRGETRITVKSISTSKFAQVLVVLSIGALGMTNISVANAATKTITCYKGTVVKKVTAANPKCPTGYSTTKPVAAKPTVAATTKSTSALVAFNGTYTGKIGLLWGDSFVQVTSVDAAGTNALGLSDLAGIGSAAPASQCDSFNGSGTLSGGGNTLKLSFDTSAKACAEDADAPTTIAITGNAVINGGTGKYAGATGTLKVTGSFAIKSTTAGKNESDAFKITLSGNINTK